MSILKEKAQYLQGLAEGMKLENEENGKVLTLMIELINDIIEEVDILNEKVELINDFNEDLIDDMEDFSLFLEAIFGDEEFDEEFPIDIEMTEGNFPTLIEGSSEDLFIVECPACGDNYYATFEDFDEDAVVCPSCNHHYQLSDEILKKLIQEHEEGE